MSKSDQQSKFDLGHWLNLFLGFLYKKDEKSVVIEKQPDIKPESNTSLPPTEQVAPPPIAIEKKEFMFEADPLDDLICRQKFGERPEFYAKLGSPKGHNGMDFRTWVNGNSNNWKMKVYAVMAGRVMEAREDNVYGKGKYVRLDHGSRGQTVYLHLSAINVSEGSSVSAGACVGISGNSGSASEGPHLHFSYKKDGFDKNNGYMGCSDPSEFFVGKVTYLP